MAFLAVAAAAWGILLAIRGTAVTREYLLPFSTVVGILGVVLTLFEKWMWHWPILHGWFVRRPDIRGTWLVELQPDEAIEPIECYMSIRQTFSTLEMKLMTPESESWLIADRIGPSHKGNGFQIAGVYTNEPRLELRGKRSEIHYGALLLEVHGPSTARPTAMQGIYWTDRKTHGTMTFSRRVKHVFTRFEDARDGHTG